MARGRWTYSGRPAAPAPSEQEKRAISQACEALIHDVLKPRFLPEVCPTDRPYLVDILGKWHGGKYRFVQRVRSDGEDDLEPEFDSPFARLEYVGHDRFDLAFFRHTGKWWTVHRGVPLTEALSLLETEGTFHPVF